MPRAAEFDSFFFFFGFRWVVSVCMVWDVAVCVSALKLQRSLSTRMDREVGYMERFGEVVASGGGQS